MYMFLTNEDLLSNVSPGGILTYFGGTEQIEILEFKTWEETLLFPSHIFVVEHYQHCVFLCVSMVFSYTKLLPLPKLKTISKVPIYTIQKLPPTITVTNRAIKAVK